jgi:hypothetical protein
MADDLIDHDSLQLEFPLISIVYIFAFCYSVNAIQMHALHNAFV